MEEKEVDTPQQIEKEDEEINIDLTKVKEGFKKFFSKDKKEQEQNKDSINMEEVKESFKKGYEETKKFTRKYGIILLILIPIFLSIFFRIQPAYLPVTENWAENSVNSFNQNVISQSINNQFPSLPQENKDRLIDAEYKKLKAQDTVFAPANGQLTQIPYKEAIKGYREAYKSRLQNDNGQTYLIAIDPYYYARYTRNIIENGHRGDEIRDGVEWSNHRVAPIGRKADKNWHISVNYVIYKISEFFGNKDLLKAVFFVPLIISTLAIIPCFFLIKRIAGNIGAVTGASLLAVHPAFMTRTVAGFADTDPYNVFFPLMIAWLFIEAFEAKNTKAKTWLGIGAGFLIGVYSRFWTGWWYILDFVLATIIIYIIITAIKRKKISFKQIKDSIKTGLFFFISAAFFVTILAGGGIKAGITSFFNSFILYPLGIAQLKDIATTKIWPNVYTTVAELNAASTADTIASIGGTLLFAIAIIGIILTMIKKEKGQRDLKYAIFLTIWFIGTIYGSTKGLRFTLLLVPAFSIAIGAFIGIIHEYAKKNLPGQLDIAKWLVHGIFILLAIGLLVSPLKAGWGQATNEIPSMNDAWWTALTNIKESSEETAIITSWWDFGHWFQYVADRPVTFDGASQNSPQAHWVGKLLLTSDETESISILRMLDCGGDTANKKLNEELKDELRSVRLIKQIIMENETEARKILEEEQISEETIEEVIKHSHCAAPEAFVIASEDMVGKAGVWGHFGSWNFDRAAMVKDVKNKEESEGITILQEKFGLEEEKAIKYYDEISSQDPNQWISPWPGYVSGLKGCQKVDENLYQCIEKIGDQKVPFIFNSTSQEIFAQSNDQKIFFSKSVYIDENGQTNERKYENAQIWISITIIKKGEDYNTLLTDPLLSSSIFTRMFFNDGKGLSCFEKFDEQTQLSGGKIYVYKVDWKCQVQKTP